MRIYIIMATWVTIKPCGFDVAKHLTERSMPRRGGALKREFLHVRREKNR